MRRPRRRKGGRGSGFSEEIASIRQQVDDATQTGKARALVVLALTPGAGATAIAVELARSFAASGREVVLIDGNPARPRLNEVFQVSVTPGTAEILRGDTDVAVALRDTGDPRLGVIAIGEGEPGASTRARWRSLFEQTLEARRGGTILEEHIVVVDGGTIDLPDAFALAGAADGVLLVVEAGRSTWEAVASAAENLARHNTTLLGIALNKRRYLIPGFLYRKL